jgi:hypothetical protein
MNNFMDAMECYYTFLPLPAGSDSILRLELGVMGPEIAMLSVKDAADYDPLSIRLFERALAMGEQDGRMPVASGFPEPADKTCAVPSVGKSGQFQIPSIKEIRFLPGREPTILAEHADQMLERSGTDVENIFNQLLFEAHMYFIQEGVRKLEGGRKA